MVFLNSAHEAIISSNLCSQKSANQCYSRHLVLTRLNLPPHVITLVITVIPSLLCETWFVNSAELWLFDFSQVKKGYNANILQVYRHQNTVLPLLSNFDDAREGSKYPITNSGANLSTLPSLDCSPMTSMDLNNLLDFSRPLLTTPSLETSKEFDNSRVYQVRLLIKRSMTWCHHFYFTDSCPLKSGSSCHCMKLEQSSETLIWVKILCHFCKRLHQYPVITISVLSCSVGGIEWCRRVLIYTYSRMLLLR